MREQTKKMTVVVLMVFTVLVAVILIPQLINLHSGVFFRMEQVLMTVAILLFWRLSYSLTRLFLFNTYKKKYKRELPYLFVTIARFMFILFALLSLLTFVFEKSIFSFLALGGLVSAGLTFALGGLILDMFSGIVHEFESHFDVGDWIKVSDEQEGHVVQINLRTVVLKSHDNMLIVIPNGKLSQGFVNYSKPDSSIWDNLPITIGYGVPIDRAERILHAALLSVEDVYQGKCHVLAERFTERGVVYDLRYMISERPKKETIRHEVMETVSKHLAEHGIKVSQYLGEYHLVKDEDFGKENVLLSIKDLVNKTPIFKGLPEASKIAICKVAEPRLYKEGDIIVQQGDKGDSLFLIEEGVADVFVEHKKGTAKPDQKKVASFGYSSIFGEMSLLLNENRSATVVAASNSLLYEIKHSGLKSALKSQPELYAKLLKEAKAMRDAAEAAKAKLARKKTVKAKKKKSLFAEFKDML